VSDPFLITGPTCISLSGGRTSAYMLWLVLQSNGGLPPQCVVCFANTGKEEEATLRFVRDCSNHWHVPITWVEYRREAPYFALVGFDSAAREGEPFAALIRSKMYLPNPVMRFCTTELKIRPMYRWLRNSGRLGDGMDMMIGIRADEQRRVVKMRGTTNSESASLTNALPLADAGVTVADVGAFWDAQPFNLELPSHNGCTLAGNCDLCFLKPANQVFTLIAQKPERAVWWVEQEKHAKSIQNDPASQGIRFRWDRPSYAQMAKYAADQGDMFDPAEEAISCYCGE
jgi:3'-phosphoadenosine 5'-phosphosulfate sulfotransferase (PAPS reductase)/FAD synthetase